MHTSICPIPQPSQRARQAPVLVVVAFALLAALTGCRADPTTSGGVNGDRVEGAYIVEMTSESTGEKALYEAFGALGLEAVAALETDRPLYAIRVARDPGPQAMSERAERVDAIVRVQPNYRYSGSGAEGFGGSSTDELDAAE